MPSLNCLKSTPVEQTPRVQQLQGMFDLPAAGCSRVSLAAEIPIEGREWAIGLVVGPSGSGKTTLLRKWFGKDFARQQRWPRTKSIFDAFPKSMSVKQIAALLTSVGFASPPAWLRPFHVLSNGEQFRVRMAWLLATSPELAIVDEYTSVVDRTVARIGSAAISKMIRRLNEDGIDGNRIDENGEHKKAGEMPTTRCRLVAAACHYDVIDWLAPDWVYDTGTLQFHWRWERQRPPIALQICRASRDDWRSFRRHHYLSGEINPAARCFLATVNNQPAAFTAVLSFPHPVRPGWREHRTVCLPDFQGVGIGTALSNFVAGLMVTTGKPYRSTTSHPAMIGQRARSPLWKMTRGPSMVNRRQQRGITSGYWKSSRGRLTASFEYTGPPQWQYQSLLTQPSKSNIPAKNGSR